MKPIKINRYKWQFLLLLVFVVLGGQINTAYGDDKVSLGYVDFPPYEYQDGEKPSGILVSIVKELFNRANIPLDLQFRPFKRAYHETSIGRLDGLFNFYKIDKRLEFFDYSIPIIDNPLVFFVRRDSSIKYQELADLKGLKVGTMLGYTYGTSFDESDLFIKYRLVNHEKNFELLTKGRLDLYPCDKLVGIYIADKEGLLDQVKILPVPLRVMKGHIGFTKGKHQIVIEKINQEIMTMRRNGEIEKYINDFIIKSSKN